MSSKHIGKLFVFQILLIGLFLIDTPDLTWGGKIDINETSGYEGPVLFETFLKNFDSDINFNSFSFTQQDGEFSPFGHLLFSTYLGGSGKDFITSVNVDAPGNIIVAGETESVDFPKFNAYDDTFGGSNDGFLTKFSSEGHLLFSTYIGGSESDWIDSVKVDASGNIILAGRTDSVDFPILNAYDNTFEGESDGFLTKFSSDGQLIFSTYIGGSSVWDMIDSVDIDASGNIILTGSTSSPDFPVLNAYDNTFGGSNDGFLTKFSSDGQLLFSSYLGGSTGDTIHFLNIDASGNIIVAGWTESTDFPIINAYDNTLGGIDDGFLTKFSPDGQLLFSTYIGGSGYEVINSVDVDASGNIIMVGETESTDFPTLKAYDNTFEGESDGFLTKFSSDGQLLFSTYIGGSGYEVINSVDVDASGNIILAGRTNSANFPTFNAYDSILGGDYDLFLSKFSFAGEILFSTFFGGSIHSMYYHEESLGSLNVDASGNIIVVGDTSTADFPMLNAYNSTLGGGGSPVEFPTLMGDGFLAILSSTGHLLFSTYLGGSAGDGIHLVDVDVTGNIIVAGNTKSADFPTLRAYNNTFGGLLEGFLLCISNENDDDNDGMLNSWEEQHGLDPTRNDAQEDLDGDGMHNFWEYLMGLLPNYDDAQEDKDGDDMPNLWEYQMGLNPTVNDAYGDFDNDDMHNFWEYEMGLNASFNDAQEDKVKTVIGSPTMLNIKKTQMHQISGVFRSFIGIFLLSASVVSIFFFYH
ncbi:MAG: SBBP repeat-containing protein [Candidatus Hodarchaeales archaeon]|jgi:hypothetical protein